MFQSAMKFRKGSFKTYIVSTFHPKAKLTRLSLGDSWGDESPPVFDL